MKRNENELIFETYKAKVIKKSTNLGATVQEGWFSGVSQDPEKRAAFRIRNMKRLDNGGYFRTPTGDPTAETGSVTIKVYLPKQERALAEIRKLFGHEDRVIEGDYAWKSDQPVADTFIWDNVDKETAMKMHDQCALRRLYCSWKED